MFKLSKKWSYANFVQEAYSSEDEEMLHEFNSEPNSKL